MMERMDLIRAQQMMKEHLTDHLEASAVDVRDQNKARLLGALHARQRAIIDCLSLVHIDMPVKQRQAELSPAPVWVKLAQHPLAGTVLIAVTLVFVLLDWQIPAALACVMLLLRAVLKDSGRMASPVATVTEVHEPYLVRHEVEHFLREMERSIEVDVNSIGTQYEVTASTEHHSLSEDLIKLYCELYQARVDMPAEEDAADVLSYALTTLRADLHALGYSTVDYSPETAALFDVLPGGIARASHMRYPAIIEEKNNLVVERGMYVRQR